MSKVDRRILKTEEAIKKAVIELMSEKKFDDITIQDISDRANINRGTLYLHYQDKFDLLGRLIETHINRLREMCEASSEMDYIEATLIWFAYFEKNYLFFATMLASKGAPYFRGRFLDLLLELFKNEVAITEGKNRGLSEDIIIRFLASAYVGIVEWWFTNGMPLSPHVMAEQVGILLESCITGRDTMVKKS